MARQTISDEQLNDALFEVFRLYGYEGASIQQLSAVTGLKKSSLYHRYPAGKEDMARAVVEYVLAKVGELVIAPLQEPGRTPEQRFAGMLDVLTMFYAGGEKNCLLNVLTLGNTNPTIRELLNQGYHAWVQALTDLGKETGLSFEQAQLRAKHFLVIVEGALVIQRVTVERNTFHESLDFARQLFFAA